MIPYMLMASLFIVLAIVAAIESSLATLQFVPWFGGMIWLRVHLITLGVMAQVLFGALPFVIAIRSGLRRPSIRWDIWLALNGGILMLLVGIPLKSMTPIIAGGVLVFIATILLMRQLASMRAPGSQPQLKPNIVRSGKRFYVAGLGYFLLGIIIGTGMWLGWMKPLGVIGNSREVHIHANNWGLMSLVFAGLLIDNYAVWTEKSLAYPRSINAIFWLMTLGAFGLVFGPWRANTYLIVIGLLLHLGATVTLLVNVIKPMVADRRRASPGLWHIVVSYFWLLAPVLMAPFVLFKVPGLPAADIEALVPQALVYGWVLQFGFAFLPFLFARLLDPQEAPKLGGSWLSLALINLGSVFLWLGIFLEASRGTLIGIAYLLWVLAMTPIVLQLWQILRRGMSRLEMSDSFLEAEPPLSV